MGIFSQFALRSLIRNRARTIVSITGIALSCALITAIFTSVFSFNQNLLEATLASEGSWQLQVFDLPADAAETAGNDSRVEESAVQRDFGAARLDTDMLWGSYLSLVSLPEGEAASDLLTEPALVDGRMPRTSSECLAPRALLGVTLETSETSGIESDGVIALGTDITLALGRRVQADTGAPISSTDYLHYNEDYTEANEDLQDVQAPTTLTVVGFYDISATWDNGAGYSLITRDDGAREPLSSTVYLKLADPKSLDELNDLGSDIASSDHASWTVHDGLLRYMGITDDRSIWNTLWQMAATLTGVVIAASISLIYNAFAISVSERTRQFGLLSSLGASKRQLRVTILTEALLLAVVGIPLGIALGLAGTWVVFHLTGGGIALIVSGSSSPMETVVVSPVALGLAVGISIATIAVSALVPAVRASRVSAVEALRSTRDVRLTRRERRQQGRGRAAGPLDRIRLRVEGVAGWIAHRNLTRASSKGRVAVASLAVSVALLVTCGTFSTYMNTIAGTVEGTGDADLAVYAGSYANAAPGTDMDDLIDGVGALDAKLSGVEGTTRIGYSISGLYATYTMPEDMTDESIDGLSIDTVHSGGTVAGTLNIAVIDDASWASYVEELGLPADAFCDPEAPRAIGYNYVRTSDGKTYRYITPFASTGTISLNAQIKHIADWWPWGISLEDGQLAVGYDYNGDDEALDAQLDSRYLPLDEAVTRTVDLPVAALADTAPACDPDLLTTELPTVILPASALPALARAAGGAADTECMLEHPFSLYTADPSAKDGIGEPTDFSIYTTYYYDAENPAEAAVAMDAITMRLQNDGTVSYASVSNDFELYQQRRMIFVAIQTFTGCFAIITGLIAVANVFNTISTSVILRRREFAVLKSIGMGNRMFARMLVRECASYAARGLCMGLVLALGVSYLLFTSMQLSFRDIRFGLSPIWVAASICAVLVILALSVIYALKVSHADSVVEALREDAI